MSNALTKTDQKLSKVSDVLTAAMVEIKGTIPTFLSPERLTTVFMSQCRKDPKLLECDALSLVKAFADAGEIGLEPDGINAHLIPYGKEVTYMVDYKGMIKLARMSGEISDMTANVVYSEDIFSHEYGSNKHLKHIKTMKSGKARGDRMCAYCYVKFKDGSEDFRVLNKDEIDHARKSSKTPKIWNSDPDPMWAKTAVRQHSKFLPKKVDALDRASKYIEDTELGEITDNMSMTGATDNNRTDLKEKLKVQKEKQLPPGPDVEFPPEEEKPLTKKEFADRFEKFIKDHKCAEIVSAQLAGIGFESLDDVGEEDFDMVMGFFEDNFTGYGDKK